MQQANNFDHLFPTFSQNLAFIGHYTDVYLQRDFPSHLFAQRGKNAPTTLFPLKNNFMVVYYKPKSQKGTDLASNPPSKSN